MKIYLLWRYDYDQSFIESAFSRKEDADRALAVRQKVATSHGEHCNSGIEERSVDDPAEFPKTCDPDCSQCEHIKNPQKRVVGVSISTYADGTRNIRPLLA